MEQKYWFDSYDFSRNEYGFSAEELDTVRSLLSAGKQVWMAPMVIEDERQLKAMACPAAGAVPGAAGGKSAWFI